MNMRNYWIGVVSKAHAEHAIAGGYAEVNHGKAGPLERMRDGDGFLFYSPRIGDRDGARVQAFTAIGRVGAGPIFRVSGGEANAPFRRSVDYLPANDAPIRPLIESLSFLRSKIHWGAAFRFGFIRIPEADFAQIATAMGCDWPHDFQRQRGIDQAIGERATATASLLPLTL